MSNWYLVVIVVLAAAGIFLLLRSRNAGASSRQEERRAESRLGPAAHVQDREDARLANMSAEDRAWETASLQRNQANEARRGALAE